MQFQMMQEFLILAETLNFLAAADKLYISQATLSKHIREMEKELGASLFTRTTRKVELTELGMRMIPYAQRAVNLQADYTKEVNAYKEQLNSYLSIGCIDYWDAIDLSMLTIEFQRIHPDVHIHITASESTELLTMVSSDLCNFAIVREEVDPPEDGLTRLLLCRDRLYAFLSKDHPLAGNRQISLAQLKEEPFLMGPDGSLSCRLGTAACRGIGFRPNIIYHGGRHQTFNYLMRGLGVGLMFGNPTGGSGSEQNIAKIPLEPQIYANINLVYKDKCLSDAGKVFIDFVRHYRFE